MWLLINHLRARARGFTIGTQKRMFGISNKTYSYIQESYGEGANKARERRSLKDKMQLISSTVASLASPVPLATTQPLGCTRTSKKADQELVPKMAQVNCCNFSTDGS